MPYNKKYSVEYTYYSYCDHKTIDLIKKFDSIKKAIQFKNFINLTNKDYSNEKYNTHYCNWSNRYHGKYLALSGYVNSKSKMYKVETKKIEIL